MAVDLHVHSTASDGTLTPRDLVLRAAERGLSAIALADHDSVDGVPEALAAGERAGVTVVPAVELSAIHEERDVHILGYFIDHASTRFRDRLRELRDARLDRARRIVEVLRADGYEVDLDDVLALSDGGAVGRSHVARALVDRGHVTDVREAFERLLGRGKPYYVPKDVTAPAEVVGLVREAGGLPVLAHPAVTGVEALVAALVPAGLAGVEAYHSEHDPAQTARCVELAREHGLLVTGGSDYHGPSTTGAELGVPEVDDAVLAALAQAAGR